MKKELTIDYCEERLFALVVMSTAMLAYGLGYCFLIWYYKVYAFPPGEGLPLEILRVAIAEILAFVFILVLYIVGGRDKPINFPKKDLYKTTPTISFTVLLIVNFLFTLQVALPIYFLGGSIESVFAGTLVAMSGLVVIVSNSWWMRLVLGGFCLSLFVLFAVAHFDVPPVSNIVAYKRLHVLTVVISTVVGLLLSWRGKFTIVGGEEEDDPVNQKTKAGKFLRKDKTGVLRIVNTNVSLKELVKSFNESLGWEQIVSRHPSISITQAQNAVGHYLQNKAKYDKEWS